MLCVNVYLIRRIEVHPKGFDWEEDKSFSVYLLGQGFIDNALKTNTFAKFKLRVLDQVNKDHLEKTCMAISLNLFFGIC